MMRMTILKVDKKQSSYGGHFYFMFMKGEDGKSYRTCLYPNYGNFARWSPYLTKIGTQVDGARILNGTVVDADSEIRAVPAAVAA